MKSAPTTRPAFARGHTDPTSRPNNGFHSKNHRYKQKPRTTTNDNASKTTKNLAQIKKRLRDIDRLKKKLAQTEVNSVKFTALEREEKSLNVLKVQHENSNLEKENAKKYHKIKFFDRKTATKHLKRLEKLAEHLSSEHDISKLAESTKSELIVDLWYTMFYPNRFKYISLYPKSSSNKDDENDDSESTYDNTDTIDSIKQLCKTISATRNSGNQHVCSLREKIKLAISKSLLPDDPRTVSVDQRTKITKSIYSILDLSSHPPILTSNSNDNDKNNDSDIDIDASVDNDNKDSNAAQEIQDEFFE